MALARLAALRHINQGSVAVLQHLVATIAQGGVADIRRQDPGSGRRAALLVDPRDAVAAPGDVPTEGMLDGVAITQDFGKHEGIFDS